MQKHRSRTTKGHHFNKFGSARVPNAPRSFSSGDEEFKIFFTIYGHDNHPDPSLVVTYPPIKLSIMKFHENIPNPYGIIAQTQNFTKGR